MLADIQDTLYVVPNSGNMESEDAFCAKLNDLSSRNFPRAL